MKHPCPGSKITTDFYERRPLSVPREKRDHIHGAIDLGAPAGVTIYAPEDGTLFLYCAFRGDGKSNPPDLPDLPFNFQGNGYFYDMYGGVMLLVSKDYTHLMTHSYMEQLHDRSDGHSWLYKESAGDSRFPVSVFYTKGKQVKAGDPIGLVGNAGYSTGAHIHWEMHRGTSWQKHEIRPNPEDFIKGKG